MRYRAFIVGVIMMGTVPLAHADKQMSVQIREGQLRERPSYLGAVVATVDYGERVQIERSQGPWRWAVSGNKQGWIHESALTPQRIRLVAGERDAGAAASQEEMALAGKGFNAEVEGEFRAQHEHIDFSWVDRMEKMVKSPEELARFLREGGVVAPEGSDR